MNSLEKIKTIQGILGVVQDGLFGPKSRAALERLIAEAAKPLPAPSPKPAAPGSLEFDARTEKNLATLHPKTLPRFRGFLRMAIAAARKKGLVVKVTSGTRTYAEQDALYAKGRTAPGSRVTNARGGYSNHNFGAALDVTLFTSDGKTPVYEHPFYREMGPIGESVGLEWGGRWSRPDEPHYAYPTGLTMAQMRKRIADGVSVL